MRLKLQSLRLLDGRQILAVVAVVLIFCTLLSGLFGGRNAEAATASTINFQARMMNNAGSIAPDGNYHIEFKLYDTASTGGTAQGVCTGNCKWIETRTTGNLVTVANGYVNVSLGSVTAFGTSIDWSKDLWLTMNVGGTGGSPSWDGEMTPRLKLTAVPYAFSSSVLAKTVTGNDVSLQFASSFGQATAITLPDPVGATATVCYQNSTSCGFAAGSATSYIQNGTTVQTGANFNIRSNAIGSVTGVLQGANGQTADLFDVQTWNGSTATTVFGVSNVGDLTVQNVNVAANKSISLASGTGTYSQAYNNNTGTAATFAVTDNASSGATTVQGVAINLTGTNNAGGTNDVSGLVFGNVAAATNNAFHGIDFGTGFNDLLRYNGTPLISGTGIVLSAAVSGSYTGITGVGTLTAGTLGAGFTTVAVGQGGTGATTLTSHGVLYGNGTGAIAATAEGATGQCLVGSTGNAPGWSSCVSSVSLQSAYAGGNTISTSSNNIGFTLNGSDSFTVGTVAGGTGSTTFSLANGSNATPPSQLVLISNDDADQILANGLTVSAATGGGITDGLDVSDSDLLNAINVGDNIILGTAAAIDFTNFDLSSSGDMTLGENADHTLTLANRSTNAAGRSLTIQGGSAGAGGSAFAGGNINIISGNADGTGGADGGDIVLQTGDGTASGETGRIIFKGASHNRNDFLQIQKSDGTIMLNVDSQANNVYLGGTCCEINAYDLTFSDDEGNVKSFGIEGSTTNDGADLQIRAGQTTFNGGTGGDIDITAATSNGASGTRTGGNIIIDAGFGATANGTINIGTVNSANINIGKNTGGSTTLIDAGTGGVKLQANGSSTGIIQVGAGGGGSANPDYLALDVKSSTGDPATAGAEGYMYYNTVDNKFRCYQNSGWTDCITTDTGVTTVGAFSSSSQANGATIAGSTITFGPADGTNPGMVSTGSQTFAGAKTFSSNVTIQGTGGLVFDTGAGGDITFANLEKIDNDTNGTINLSADSGAVTLLLTGSAANINNSAGTLTLNSFNNTITIDSSDTTLSATGLTTLNLGTNTSINSGGSITLDATSTVIIPNADTLQSDDVTSTSSLTFTTAAASNIVFNTGGTVRGTFDTSNSLYLGNGLTAASPNNFTISGTGSSTTAVAGGTITVQGGNATVGNANGGNVTLTGGTGFGTGVRGLVVIDTPTLTTTTNDANCYTSGALVASSCTITSSSVNNSAAVLVGFSAASQVATVPDPTITTAGRILYITAANGTSDFTLRYNTSTTPIDIAMRANNTATLIWNGSDWTAAGASSSTDLQSAYNNTLTSAGGAELIVSNGTSANGLTIRDSTSNPVNGTLLEVQTQSAANLLSANASVTDYASNGGAETAGASSSTFPASTWSAVGSTTLSRYTTAGGFIATGAASVSVATTTAANDGVKNTLTTALTANQHYNASFATRLSSGTFTDMSVYYSIDGTAASVVCKTGQAVATSVWTKVNCAFTAPSSGITSGNAILIRQTGSGTGRTFYIDNLSITIAADLNYATDGGVDDAGNFATNWSFVNATSGAGSVSRNTSDGNDASDSAGVTITTGAANAGLRNKLSINPLVSTLYRVSVYAKVSSGSFTDFKVRYSRDGSTGSSGNYVDCADYNTQTLSTSAWTQITCYITTDGTTPTNPYVNFVEASSATRTFYVDTFSMTLASTATPNVQIGGGLNGGPTTLFTLDRAASAPIAANNDAFLGSMYYDTTLGKLQCYESDGWGACGSSPDVIVTLSPEYTNAVLHGPSGGTIGVGTMTSDICSDALNINDGSSGQATICGTNETFNFYKWTSPQPTSQTYGIYVTYQLPTTFKSFASGATSVMGRTDDGSSGGSATVVYKVYRNSSSSGLTQCGSTVSVSSGTVSSWQIGLATGAADPSTCSFAPGDSIVFEIDMTASKDANAYVGNLGFTFSNK